MKTLKAKGAKHIPQVYELMESQNGSQALSMELLGKSQKNFNYRGRSSLLEVEG